MEHKLIQGGEEHLPFARSRIKALRAAGLVYASQHFEVKGSKIWVQLKNGQEYIKIEGPSKGNIWVLVYLDPYQDFGLVAGKTDLPRKCKLIRFQNFNVDPIIGRNRKMWSLVKQSEAAGYISEPVVDLPDLPYGSGVDGAVPPISNGGVYFPSRLSHIDDLKNAPTGFCPNGNRYAELSWSVTGSDGTSIAELTQVTTVLPNIPGIGHTTTKYGIRLVSAAYQAVSEFTRIKYRGLNADFSLFVNDDDGAPSDYTMYYGDTPPGAGTAGGPVVTTYGGFKASNPVFLGGVTIDSVTYDIPHFVVTGRTSFYTYSYAWKYIHPVTGEVTTDATIALPDLAAFGNQGGSTNNPISLAARTTGLPEYTRKEVGWHKQGYNFIQCGGSDSALYDRRNNYIRSFGTVPGSPIDPNFGPHQRAFAITKNLYVRFANVYPYGSLSYLELVQQADAASTGTVLATIDLKTIPCFANDPEFVAWLSASFYYPYVAGSVSIHAMPEVNTLVGYGSIAGSPYRSIGVQIMFDQASMFDPTAVWWTPPIP